VAQATKEKPAEVVAAPDAATAMLEAVRAQAEAMLADAREATAAMLEQAREEARKIAATAGDEVASKERLLVEQAQADLERLTAPGAGKVWKAQEVEPGFEWVTFKALGGVKSEHCVIRVGRHEWTAPNGLKETSEGILYQFIRGEFVAKSRDVADFLRSRPSFGSLYWEEGSEPHAPPNPAKALDEVMDAVMELDEGALERLLEREQASHNRLVVVQAIKRGRARIRGRLEGA
jgi:hypothetical protein